MTPQERALRASLAAHTKWSRTPDRSGATAAARAAARSRFEKQVDPDGELDPETRVKLARNAELAHYARMRASRARKNPRRGARRGSEQSE